MSRRIVVEIPALGVTATHCADCHLLSGPEYFRDTHCKVYNALERDGEALLRAPACIAGERAANETRDTLPPPDETALEPFTDDVEPTAVSDRTPIENP